jgi:hypothetical protein
MARRNAAPRGRDGSHPPIFFRGKKMRR